MEKKQWSRRNLLKSLGITAAAAPLTGSIASDQSLAMESHLMGFQAEASRLDGGTVLEIAL